MSYRLTAEILGIDEPQSDMDLIKIVRQGLPSEGVTILSDKFGISPGELSKYLHVSHKTLQRYKGKVLDVKISGRLLNLALVYSKGVEVLDRKRTRFLGSRALFVPWTMPVPLTTWIRLSVPK